MVDQSRRPKEPRAVTATYIMALRRIWGVTQGLVAYGLWPLFELWPREGGQGERIDAKRSRLISPGIVSAYPKYPPRHGVEYNPLAKRPLLPRIWNLSDAELRALWPTLDPRDIREHAPWAVSRTEVRRIMGQGPLADMREVEAFVRASIETSRLAQPAGAPPQIDIVPPRRAPYAFQLRPREYATVVLGADGLPIPTPPLTRELSVTSIQRSLEWIDLATAQVLHEDNIAGVVGPVGRQLDLFNSRDLKRVIGIDVREVPGVPHLLDQWIKLNVNLIESGLQADFAMPRLRPAGLLPDVAKVVKAAYVDGIRVEVLAHDLKQRFRVSDRRAEFIARDQVLKLNGQLNRHRQLGVGIEEYEWDTSGDERVRTSHRELDEKIFSWHSPPFVGHPGQDYLCRCVAIPVIPEGGLPST